MTKKIFDERGFLNKEGKIFINDGFVKELKRVMATAENASDVLVIGSILKTIVGEAVFEHTHKFQTTPTTDTISNKKPAISAVHSQELRDLLQLPNIPQF